MREYRWKTQLGKMRMGGLVTLSKKDAILFAQAVCHSHREYRIVTRKIDAKHVRCKLTKREPK